MKNRIYQISKKISRRCSHFLNDLLKKNKFYNRYVFSKIYKYDLFNSFSSDKESKSGPGSNFKQTEEIIIKIPELIKKFNIKSVLDLPCGDFYWMNRVDLGNVDYIGGDIVSEVIRYNNTKFAKTNISFREIDIINDILRRVDMILCRDLFVHLKNDQISTILKNIKNSGSKYLLTTSFKLNNLNIDIDEIGNWRPINLEIAPFYLNDIVDQIYENCTESDGRFNDKYLILYSIDKL